MTPSLGLFQSARRPRTLTLVGLTIGDEEFLTKSDGVVWLLQQHGRCFADVPSLSCHLIDLTWVFVCYNAVCGSSSCLIVPKMSQN